MEAPGDLHPVHLRQRHARYLLGAVDSLAPCSTPISGTQVYDVKCPPPPSAQGTDDAAQLQRELREQAAGSGGAEPPGDGIATSRRLSHRAEVPLSGATARG